MLKGVDVGVALGDGEATGVGGGGGGGGSVALGDGETIGVAVGVGTCAYPLLTKKKHTIKESHTKTFFKPLTLRTMH